MNICSERERAEGQRDGGGNASSPHAQLERAKMMRQ